MNNFLYPERHACPCGYFGDPTQPCTYSSTTVTRYQKCIFSPLIDRIAIHMQVPRVEFAKLRDLRPGENSMQVRVRVEAVRELQRQRCEETSIARGHQEAVVTLVER